MVERKNRTLVEMAHCLIQAKDLSNKLWDEVVYDASYLLNLVLTQLVSYMTIFKKWCGKKPSIGHVRTFIFFSWENISNAHRKKLDAKSHVCIMMGYSKESKSYRLFDLVKQQIIINRNVIFDDNSSRIKLLNSSSGLLHSDPFYIVSNNGPIIPLFGVSSNQSTSPPELIGS